MTTACEEGHSVAPGGGWAERAQQAAAALRDRLPGIAHARVVAILGSGLGGYVDRLAGAKGVDYDEIPGFPTPAVAGHSGRVVLAWVGAVPAVLLQGRVHLYEGWSPQQAVAPLRAVLALGVRRLIVTNAAGGIAPEFRVGDVMRIEDHLNLTGRNPLVGPPEPLLGSRFPDMTQAYDPEGGRVLEEAAAAVGLRCHRGVYAALLGPSYETPAEIRMLRLLGAHAVGMSTVHEVIAARHAGARVVGLSLITNAAAGSVPGATLSHDEVTATAAEGADRLARLLSRVIEGWAGAA